MSTEACTFVCPDCGESVEINAAMKDAIIEHGCAVCGASVPAGAFSCP